MSSDLIRLRFARFIERALTSARTRGMTDRDIHTATGVRPSTYYRWRRGEVRTAPDIGTVRDFCAGLGIDVNDALAALGMAAERENPAPEPVIDPDLRKIMRTLLDPNTPESEKVFIREALHMLANRPTRAARKIG